MGVIHILFYKSVGVGMGVSMNMPFLNSKLTNYALLVILQCQGSNLC